MSQVDSSQDSNPEDPKDSNESTPQTGDETPIMTFIILFILSLFTIIGLSIYIRKGSN